VLVGGVSLWLTAALAEPAFLTLVVGAGIGMWLRRDERAAAAADPAEDDWD
jgi:hypothetical protein